MRLKKVLVLAVIIAFAYTGAALAVPPGKTIEFEGGKEGKVTFDGKKHADAGKKCPDCHKADLFPKMKKGTVQMTMKDINEGKFCGHCHDGKATFKAGDKEQPIFSASDKQNCGKCHKK
ncbi:MAG: cytochrome C [Nitrospirae bacterium]|nr:cytochrome C [Nitrospirota bacterium]MBF0592857.1 cytochrome C [Nitrospirota bacterium]